MKLLMKSMILLLSLFLCAGCLTIEMGGGGDELPPSYSDEELTRMLEDIIGFSELLATGPIEGLTMSVDIDEDQNLICRLYAEHYDSLDTGYQYEGSHTSLIVSDTTVGAIISIDSLISMVVDGELSLDLDYRYYPSDDSLLVTTCYINGERYDDQFVRDTVTLR